LILVKEKLKSATTSKGVYDRALFTTETQRTQSLVSDLFSFDPAEKRGNFRTQENKSQHALRRKEDVVHMRVLIAAAKILAVITL